MMKKHTFLSLVMLAVTVLLSTATIAQPPVGDLLLYYESERQPAGINAYNPATGETLELPVTIGVEHIHISGDGRIAYIQDNDVWVLDVLNAPDRPINITQTPDIQESLIDWTPDGRILQFAVGSLREPDLLYNYDGNEVLAVDYGREVTWWWNDNSEYISTSRTDQDEINWYIWNGQERIDLLPFAIPDLLIFITLKWSPSDHFIANFGYAGIESTLPEDQSDTFYWNGNALLEVESPFDNSTLYVDNWSTDGRLTLYTYQNAFIRWYIWDGVSFTPEGIPDLATLTPVNHENETIDDVAWMPDGRLAIVATGNPDSNTLLGHPYTCVDPCKPQVFLWDSESMQQVTTNEFGDLLMDVHESGKFVVFDLNGMVIWGLTVYDNNQQPVFRSEGPYSLSRWSADGNLAYCFGDDLMLWNGQDSVQLNSRTFSKWLLASSPSMLCSTG